MLDEIGHDCIEMPPAPPIPSRSCQCEVSHGDCPGSTQFQFIGLYSNPSKCNCYPGERIILYFGTFHFLGFHGEFCQYFLTDESCIENDGKMIIEST